MRGLRGRPAPGRRKKSLIVKRRPDSRDQATIPETARDQGLENVFLLIIECCTLAFIFMFHVKMDVMETQD